MLGIRRGIHPRLWCALETFHPLQDCLFLLLEEPFHALSSILHATLQRHVPIVAQELYDDVSPRGRALHGTSCLEHVALLHLTGNVRKAHEDLNLRHQSPKLSTTIDLNIAGAYLHILSKVMDVVLQIGEIIWEQIEMLRSFSLVELVKLTQLILQRHATTRQCEDTLHDVCESVCARRATLPSRCQDPCRFSVFELRQQLLLPLCRRNSNAIQACDCGAQRRCKHLFCSYLHVTLEIPEAYHGEILLTESPRLHHRNVL
mmetsp:Transcript_4709/g.8576  ORF Transcript_4709/g.8576 Transcript_4709/m.8576 type:complete len:260 (-) Transcript_4709:864-1643(-)